MAYKVKFKFRDQWFWKSLSHVVEDGFVQETSQFPIRFFILENGSRVEVPCEDTIFRICDYRTQAKFQAAPQKTAALAVQTTSQTAPSPAASGKSLSPQERGMAYARLSQVYFWLGEYSTNDADKDLYFGQGVEAGKKAVELVPDSVEANLWYAASMGSHGMVRGIMSSLFYLGPIEKHGKKAMDLDEKYFHAAPLRLMGRFYHQAPGWPIGTGDTNKAVTILERAVKLGPDFLFNQIYLADAYISKRRKDEAKKLLEDVKSRPVNEQFPMHHRMIVNDAEKLLNKL